MSYSYYCAWFTKQRRIGKWCKAPSILSVLDGGQLHAPVEPLGKCHRYALDRTLGWFYKRSRPMAMRISLPLPGIKSQSSWYRDTYWVSLQIKLLHDEKLNRYNFTFKLLYPTASLSSSHIALSASSGWYESYLNKQNGIFFPDGIKIDCSNTYWPAQINKFTLLFPQRMLL